MLSVNLDALLRSRFLLLLPPNSNDWLKKSKNRVIDFDICLCYTDIVKLYEIQKPRGDIEWNSLLEIKSRNYENKKI